ncbi:MAG: hypothetical protein LBU45_07415 [Azoarcus sp.]|nr:hypothetical protein [Azoarcus sp.]
MKQLISICLLSFLACMIAPLAQAARTAPMPKFEHEVIVYVPDQNPEKAVHDAILKGAQRNNWNVLSDSGGTLRLSLVVRNKHTIVVDVRILGNAVAVDYVSSVNMAYEKDAQQISVDVDADTCQITNSCDKRVGEGEIEVIHPNYGRWVRNLLKAARKAVMN